MITALNSLPENNKHVYFASMVSQYSAKPFCVFSRKLDISQFTPADSEKSILKKSVHSIDALPPQPKPKKTNRYSLFPQFFNSITLIFMVIFYQLQKWKGICTMISSFLLRLLLFVKSNWLHFSTSNNSNSNHVHKEVTNYSIPVNSPSIISIEIQKSI